MIDILVSFCTTLIICSLYILFSEGRKGQQHDKRVLLSHARQDINFSRTRRVHNLSVLRITTHPDALFTEINRERRTYTPVKTGPQSYPSRQAYLRRRLVIARQSYHALQSDPPNSILGYVRYLHRRRR